MAQSMSQEVISAENGLPGKSYLGSGSGSWSPIYLYPYPNIASLDPLVRRLSPRRRHTLLPIRATGCRQNSSSMITGS
jgi:hypothetical protein